MVRKPGALLTIVTLLVVACATVKPITVKDPGVRGGPPGAGDPLPGLTPAELEFFRAGLEQFVEVEEVKGSSSCTTAGPPTSSKPSWRTRAGAMPGFLPRRPTG